MHREVITLDSSVYEVRLCSNSSERCSRIGKHTAGMWGSAMAGHLVGTLDYRSRSIPTVGSY